MVPKPTGDFRRAVQNTETAWVPATVPVVTSVSGASGALERPVRPPSRAWLVGCPPVPARYLGWWRRAGGSCGALQISALDRLGLPARVRPLLAVAPASPLCLPARRYYPPPLPPPVIPSQPLLAPPRPSRHWPPVFPAAALAQSSPPPLPFALTATLANETAPISCSPFPP